MQQSSFLPKNLKQIFDDPTTPEAVKTLLETPELRAAYLLLNLSNPRNNIGTTVETLLSIPRNFDDFIRSPALQLRVIELASTTNWCSDNTFHKVRPEGNPSKIAYAVMERLYERSRQNDPRFCELFLKEAIDLTNNYNIYHKNTMLVGWLSDNMLTMIMEDANSTDSVLAKPALRLATERILPAMPVLIRGGTSTDKKFEDSECYRLLKIVSKHKSHQIIADAVRTEVHNALLKNIRTDRNYNVVDVFPDVVANDPEIFPSFISLIEQGIEDDPNDMTFSTHFFAPLVQSAGSLAARLNQMIVETVSTPTLESANHDGLAQIHDTQEKLERLVVALLVGKVTDDSATKAEEVRKALRENNLSTLLTIANEPVADYFDENGESKVFNLDEPTEPMERNGWLSYTSFSMFDMIFTDRLKSGIVSLHAPADYFPANNRFPPFMHTEALRTLKPQLVNYHGRREDSADNTAGNTQPAITYAAIMASYGVARLAQEVNVR